jgi:hypothetical protein
MIGKGGEVGRSDTEGAGGATANKTTSSQERGTTQKEKVISTYHPHHLHRTSRQQNQYQQQRHQLVKYHSISTTSINYNSRIESSNNLLTEH